VSSTPPDVDLSVALRLVVPDADAVPLPVSLRYAAADPYAVTVAFRGDDVHIWPGNRGRQELVFISLTSPDGQAVLEADRRDVSDFLDQTTYLVPPGREDDFVNLDAEIALLLAG